jgi:hypothetical protein
MQIPLRVACASCQKPATHRVRLDQSSVDWTCKHCGYVHWGFFDLDFTIGFLLLERSKFELQEEKDYSMSIVLAAAGLDSEMTRMLLQVETHRDRDLLVGVSVPRGSCTQASWIRRATHCRLRRPYAHSPGHRPGARGWMSRTIRLSVWGRILFS